MWSSRCNLLSSCAVFIIINLFLHSSVFAQEKNTVEKVSLEMDGKRVVRLGRNACKPDAKVKVLLPNTIEGDEFRWIRRAAQQKPNAKTGSVCKKTLDQVLPDEYIFSKSSPYIDAQRMLAKGACSKSPGSAGAYVLCIYEGSESEGELVAEAHYSFNTKVAKIEKTNENMSAINGEVSFKITASGISNSITYEVCYGKTTDDVDIDDPNTDCPKPYFSMHTSKDPNITIKGLVNKTSYRFKVRLLEQQNPPTPWSKSFEAIPIHAFLPFEVYEGAGGNLEFSCQQSGSSSLVLFFMTAVVLFLLRKKYRAKTFIPSVFMLMIITTFFYTNDSHAELGQVNVGLLGAMYRPDLDSEQFESGENMFPFYKCFFRKDTSDENGPINPLLGAEVDVHLFDDFGSLQLGLGVSYTFVTGHALKEDDAGLPDCNAPLTNSTITLHMYQLRPQLTYLFDPFKEYVPLIPYVRAALIAHGYMFRARGKSMPEFARADRTLKPNGFRFGYQAAVGVMLMLDFLEPGAIRAAQGEGMFKHVYLKGELSYTKIDTFGEPGYQFSAKDVMGTSLPLMWTFGLVFELP